MREDEGTRQNNDNCMALGLLKNALPSHGRPSGNAKKLTLLALTSLLCIELRGYQSIPSSPSGALKSSVFQGH